jgi:hypothetical protein
MRFFFTDRPSEWLWRSSLEKFRAHRSGMQPAPEYSVDAGSIVAALRALAERIGARRKPESTSHDSGPRTLAEISAAGAKLWPRRLPLPLASGKEKQ